MCLAEFLRVDVVTFCDDCESVLAVTRDLRGKFQSILCMGSPCKRVGGRWTADNVKTRRAQRIGVRSARLCVCLVHDDGRGRNIVVQFNLSDSGSDPSLEVTIFLVVWLFAG